MEKALEASKLDLSEETMLACQLGALLHDANDRKYFPNSNKTNMRVILE